jgi:hypothetical protein
MTNDHRQRPPAKRIVLPSGRSIEIVRIGEGRAGGATPRPLHVCPYCASELVHPSSWEPVREGWLLELLCPNCWWSDSVLAGEQQVQALEERLERALEGMIAELRRLVQANMLAEIRRFAAALHHDAILPEDF